MVEENNGSEIASEENNEVIENEAEDTENTDVIDESEDAGSEDSSEPVKEDPAPKSFNLVVNGKKVEVKTVDDLIALAQKGLASHEKFESAAQQRKQAERLLSIAKNNPIDLLKLPELGLGEDQVQELVENYLAEKIQFESMDEETRALHLKAKRAEELEKRLKEIEDADNNKAVEAKTREIYETTEKQIISALDRGGVSKNAKTVAKMAEYMYRALQQDEVLSADEAVEMVKMDMQAEIPAFLGGLDPDKIVAQLGPEVTEAVRQHLLGKVKNPTPDEDEEESVSEYSQRKGETLEEWNLRLDKIMGV